MKSRVIRVFCFSSHIHNFCITSSIISSSISSSINSIISDDVIADVISDISKQPMSVVLLHIRKLKTSEMNHVWSSLKFTSNIWVCCAINLLNLLNFLQWSVWELWDHVFVERDYPLFWQTIVQRYVGYLLVCCAFLSGKLYTLACVCPILNLL